MGVSHRKEVAEGIYRNNSILLISDISKKVSMITEIQGFIRDGKIEFCVLRMKDLKVLFNDLVNHEGFSTLLPIDDFNIAQTDFNIDLQNFQRHLINEKNKIDKSRIIENLEGLSTILLSAEGKLKKLRP